MTTQVNVRLDDTLLHEIDTITKVLQISRTEWLRMKIALAVRDDSLHLSESIALEFAKGNISEEDLRTLLGNDADDIIFVVRNMKRGKQYIDDMVEKGRL